MVKKSTVKNRKAIACLISAGILLTAGLISCSQNGPAEPPFVQVTNIEIETLNGKNVSVGGTLILNAEVLPANATNTDVIWSSSDETMATVEDGVVTGISKTSTKPAAENSEEENSNEEQSALSENAVVIRATSDSDNSVFAEYTIYILDEVVYSSKLNLKGKSATFVGKTFAITPEWDPVPTDTTILWSTSNSEKATVTEDGVVTALSTTAEDEPVVITAKAFDGVATATFPISITAEPIPVESISISVNAENLKSDADGNYIFIGETADVEVTILPANATNQKYEITVSDETLATTEGNVITANSADKTGTLTVYVTTIADEDAGDDLEDYTAKDAEVTLNINRPVSSITLTSSDYDTEFGIPVSENSNTATVIAAVNSETENAPTNTNLTWTSSDETVATVEDGVVTAVSEGSATITASSTDGSNVTETFEIKTYIPLKGITLSTKDGKTSYKALSKAELSVAYNPANATYKNISFDATDGITFNTDSLEATMGDEEATASITVTTAQGSFTSTVTLSVSLDTSALEAAISSANAKLESVDENNITTDVTEAGSYLKDVVDALSTSIANGTASLTAEKQTEINAATKDLSDKTAACKPIALYAPVALNKENVRGIIYASDATITSDKNNSNGWGDNRGEGGASKNLSAEENKTVTTEDNETVKLITLSEKKGFSFADLKLLPADGYSTKAHLTVLTSSAFNMHFTIWENPEVVYTFKIDPVNGKVYFVKDGEETDVNATITRDEKLWFNIDFTISDYFDAKMGVNDALYNIMFSPVAASAKFYLANIFFTDYELGYEFFQTKLSKLIDEINDFVNSVEIGDGNGQYPQSAKSDVLAAIEEKSSLLTSTDKASLQAAIQSLNTAFDEFKLSQKGIVKALISESDFAAKTAKSLATGKTAVASSSNGTSTPSLAFDGNIGEPRWAAGSLNDNEWIYVDLGKKTEFNQCGIKWEGAFASKYTILYSDTAEDDDWTPLITVSDITSAEIMMISINPAISARYVKVNLDKAGTPWMTSFYEMFIINE